MKRRELLLTVFLLGGTLSPGLVLAQAAFTIETTTASPNPVAPGASATITTTILDSGGAASGVLIDMGIWNASGVRVNQQVTTGQAFSAGQRKTFQWTWAVPSGQATGAYRISMGVFAASWSSLYVWVDSAATLTVQSGGGGFTLTVSRAGAGTVTSAPSGIDCGLDCAETYASGTSVTLTATPAGGSTLTSWSGACSGTATACTVAMTANRSVTATFGTASGPPGFTVDTTTASPNPVSRSTTTTITSSIVNTGGAASGVLIDMGIWSASGTRVNQQVTTGQAFQAGERKTFQWTWAVPSGQATGAYRISMGVFAASWSSLYVWVDSAATLTVQSTPTFTLTVSRTGAGAGTVTSVPAGINCGTDCTEPYATGATVTLTATPASGATFAGWSGGGCSGSGSCVVTLTAGTTVTATFTTPLTDNPVVVENRQPGSSGWQLGFLVADDGTKQIKGFASATSVGKNVSLTFYVTVDPAQSFTMDVYRIGWYGGLGGPARAARRTARRRQTARLHPEHDHRPDLLPQLVGQLHPHGAGELDERRLPGRPHQRRRLPELRDLRRARRAAGPAPLPGERDDLPGLQQLSGRRADGEEPLRLQQLRRRHRRREPAGGEGLVRPPVPVRGGRPLPQLGDPTSSAGSSGGYDVTYSTDLDTHADGASLRNHRAFLSVGHDEYWSKEMFDAAESARAAGVSLGFFGADAVYWQVRFEPSATGAADRVMVCYKAAGIDPVQGPTTTVRFRDDPVNRPEQTLVGVMYTAEVTWDQLVPYVVTNSSHPVYAGTGFQDGDQVPGIVGYEMDRYVPEYPQPPHTSYAILSQSPLIDLDDGQSDVANAVLYQAPGGAWVFAAGTISWSWGLDDFERHLADGRIQQTTVNILSLFGVSRP